MSTPLQPSLVLTSPRSPPPTTSRSTTTSTPSLSGRTLRTSRSFTQQYTLSESQTSSRSPSPHSEGRRLSSSSNNSTSARLSALAAAGLGLLSLPPSPNPEQHSFDLAGTSPEDEQEELATPPRGRTNHAESPLSHYQEHRKSSLGFLEPEKDPKDRARTRKMSFGLGLEGKLRRLSFGGGGGQQGGSSSNTEASPTRSDSASSLSHQAQARKSNKPKTLIRRAKSFGTSPILGGSADTTGSFPSAVSSDTIDEQTLPLPIPTTPYSSSYPGSTAASPTSVHPSLSRLTTSSVSLASSTHSANSPNQSTPITPLSGPTFSGILATSGQQPQLAVPRTSQDVYSAEEPAQTQSHWLLSPLASTSKQSSESVNGKGKRRESEERTGLGFEVGPEIKNGGKEKEKRKTSALRRATLSVFGRKDSSSAVTTLRQEVDEPRRNSIDPPNSYFPPVLTDSPNQSPGPSRKNSSAVGLPSLPSLPSLQLSNNPYRMSWAFGSGSPTTSPAPSPARHRPSGTQSRSESPVPTAIPLASRPSLTISPVPSPRFSSSSQSSPTSANPSSISSISPAKRSTLDQLPVPPLLVHSLSTDSSKTLIVTLPSNGSSNVSSATRATRASSISSPPLLRRTASYAPANPPSPSSPLASPSLPLPSTSEPSPLDRRRTLTRSSRSHSDASDRRSTPLATPPLSSGSSFVYGGGRGSVTGGLGVPPGGGYFSSAHYKSGATPTARRPGTADSPSMGGRTSVFGFSGGWGSLFGSSNSSSASPSTNPTASSTGASVSMSRSSSAATSTPSTPGASGIETNEFGALFDAATGGNGGKLTRPGTGRKRGLSVGNGFFGSSSTSNSNAMSGTSARDREMSRARSGSGSSAASDAPLKAPGVLGRMRASTDPNKRLSLGSGSLGGLGPNASNASLGLSQTGGGTSSRPVTADGVASLFGGGSNGNRKRGSSLSFVTSSQQSTTSPQIMQGFREEPKPAKKYPTPRIELGETPEGFVKRLVEGEGEDGDGKVAKGDVSRVLSASAIPFYERALAAYLRCFPFESLPLDIALRLFLCSSSLPPETQQIDRVMEAFARRWCECNPEVFASKNSSPVAKTPSDGQSVIASSEQEGAGRTPPTKSEASDIPYVLAFSMVMLNTDAFNPNAKSKMTKADYVKNTRIDGVASEVLEYLYDQITLAPFVFVDEDNPASAFFDPSPTLSSSLSKADPSASISGPGGAGNTGSFFGSSSQKPKIDPYHFIATGQTKRFRVDVESHIPFRSPFSYTGTTAFFNATTLHALFAKAPILQTSNRPRAPSRTQTTATGVALQHPSLALAGSPLVPTTSTSTFVPTPARDKSTISSLKITKVGVLSRKEDLAEGGRKAASRKWKAWTVVLTGSQLLFFKDAHFAHTLQQTLVAASASSHPRPDDSHVLVFTLQTPFKPDAVLSLNNSAAIFDTTYRRHPNVFRLVAPAGRQYLFQAHDSEDLNTWLHAINYAASFKTANVRIRPLQPPTLRSSTNSPVPASPALSTRSSMSFRPTNMTWGTTTTSMGSNASNADTLGRRDSAALDSRQDSAATIRPAGSNQTAFASEARTSVIQDDGRASTSEAPEDVLNLSTSKPLPDLPHATPTFPPPLMPIVNCRADILRARINDLDEAIVRVRKLVHDDLCLAKHLSILTPFRSSTREKVLTAIPPVEKRIRQTRMELVKLICYREVLSRDLLVEDRETERFVRQRSLRRTTSQKTRSPTSPKPQEPTAHWASPLSQSHSSLAVPFGGDGSLSETGRESFESATESLRDDSRNAYTDDELDRLQVRSPPPMQRSRTEQDWAATVDHLRSPSDPPLFAHDDELEIPVQTESTPTVSAASAHLGVIAPTKALSPTPSTTSLAPSP